MIYNVKRRGTRNESHQTFSLPLVIPPDAPAALGASGIPVPCVPADERVDEGRPDILAEVPVAVMLETADADDDGVGDIEARDAERWSEYGDGVEKRPFVEESCVDVDTIENVVWIEEDREAGVAIAELTGVERLETIVGSGADVAELDKMVRLLEEVTEKVTVTRVGRCKNVVSLDTDEGAAK